MIPGGRGTVNSLFRAGQEMASHIRPYCQYTWIALSGVADYFEGSSAIGNIKSGDIAVAKPGQIDGVMDSVSTEFFNLVSVATPGKAGLL
jgi:hypothetical protein